MQKEKTKSCRFVTQKIRKKKKKKENKMYNTEKKKKKHRHFCDRLYRNSHMSFLCILNEIEYEKKLK